MPKLYNSTQTGKFIFFAYAMIGIAFLFVVQLLLKKEIKIKLSVLDILLFVLLAYIIINRYFIQDIYSFSLRFYELIGLAVLYVVLRSIPRKYYIFFLLAVITGGIIQAVYGNLQLLGFYNSFNANFKMTGTFFNPGPYAGYLAAIFPLALGIYLFRNKLIEELPVVQSMPQWLRQILLEYLPLAGILSILLVLPASRSRAAWLAAGLSSTLLLAIKYQFKYHFNRIFNEIYKKLIALSLLVLLTAGSLYGIYVFKKNSADGRLLIWTVSANIIKDYPLFGVGFDRFKAHYMNYQATYFQDQPESKYAMVADNVQYAFNEVLQFFVENGLLGGLLAFAVFAYVIYHVNFRQTTLSIIIIGLLSIISFSLFSYPSHILPLMLILMILMSLSNEVLGNNYLTGNFSNMKMGIQVRSFCSIIILFGIGYSVISINKLSLIYKNWYVANRAYNFGMYEEGIKYYKKSYAQLLRNGEFLQHYGKALSMAENHENAIDVLEEAAKHYNTTITHTTLGDSYQLALDLKNSEESYMQAYYMVPNRFYPKYLLAKLYDKTGQRLKAVRIAEEIVKKNYKINSTAIYEIKREMKFLLQNNL
ncbi:MAG: O-antigen ligase family protein [Bacteroidota bacterium]